MMSVYLYNEWGLLISGKVYTNGFYSDNYLYNGEAMDITTELYYLRARYYDPSQGRFMQQDTFLGYIETPISQNLYIYCYNSPLNYIDPSGNRVNTSYGRDRAASYIKSYDQQLENLRDEYDVSFGYNKFALYCLLPLFLARNTAWYLHPDTIER